MSEITVHFFSVTTAEDQNNYFFGDLQERRKAFEGSNFQLTPGTYRVIDGELSLIIGGFSPEEVRHRLSQSNQVKS